MAVSLEDKLARLPGERRAKIDARAAELIAEEMTLRDLRRALDRTQVHLARELGVKQETVSRLEKRSDMLLSTLRSYVAAMGGELDMVAKFPDRPPVRLKTLAPMLAEKEPHARTALPAASRPRKRAKTPADGAGMRQVSLNDLRALQAEILAFFGSELLGRAVETIGLPHYEGRRVRTTAHPLATWWRSFQRDIDTSFQRNAISFSRESARLLELYTALQEIKSLPNFDRILTDIQNKSKFYSATFEAILAAMYRSSGYNLTITAEGEVEGEKAPDFIVYAGCDRVNVEAKSLEDLSSGEDERIDQMCFEIEGVLAKNKRCARVRIDFSKRVSGSECARVVRNVDHLLQTAGDAGTWMVQGICRVDIAPIGRWGDWFPGPWLPDAEEEGRRQFYSAETIVTAEGKVSCRNPQIISVSTHFEPRIDGRIIKQMRASSPKFRSGEAAVVHILLPCWTGTTLIEVIDASYNEVFNKLNKDYRRINAVVLSAQLYGNFEDAAIRYNHYIIPNMRPQTELSEGFKLLFSDVRFEEQLGQSGGASMEFRLWRPLEEQTGSTLLWHCSKDGKSQIRIWSTYHGKLRAELVCVAHGRVICESRVDRDLGDAMHLLAVTWSDTEMVLSLDGERIATTNLKRGKAHMAASGR
jgi:DNA-binding XRE family transcriptional regulator